ncbi:MULTISPECIES: NACHT domain-containing protein [Cryobacterium]|uniref:NACHT domain-containing protein n=1 Tax=Cryobacterium TaxID=69578 RepID=UPI000CD3ECC6|nr:MULTISPECIES: pentapeptide repeat-containing protein [Cryobacterium]POH67783.1 hypothetical protein C3B60_06065 [Cryobacterium zongtaii]TFC47782.1 hypothetical protein E3O57_02255 [Cryobacterium sp. TMN-39-2]
MEPSTIIGAIMRAAVPLATKQMRKSERAIALMRAVGIDTTRMPTTFDELYATSLVLHCIDKPADLAAFFRDEYLRESFRSAFESNDSSVLEKEADVLVARMNDTGGVARMDYDPRRDIGDFAAVFWDLLQRSRSPHEVSVDRQFDAVLAQSEKLKDEVASLGVTIQTMTRAIETLAIRTERLASVGDKRRLKVAVVADAGIVKAAEIEAEFYKLGFDAQVSLYSLSDEAGSATLADMGPDVLAVVVRSDTSASMLGCVEDARAASTPTFVFLDTGHNRPASLEAFLKRHVFSADTAVKWREAASLYGLEPDIAGDAADWLTRQYRTLTAQFKSSQTPDRQSALTVEAATRIQSFARTPLEQGTALDLLYSDVDAWFKALGFHREGHMSNSDRHIEFIVQVPSRRRYDRVVVRVVSGEATTSDVLAIRDAVDLTRSDEGWIVSASRVSPAAREASAAAEKLECFTLDELIDQDANFDAYLDWLDEEVTLRHIDSMYVPLDSRKREPGAEGLYSRYGESNGGTEGYLNRWLADPSKEHISVLGEFGTGKTWLTLHYAWGLAQRYREAKEAGTTRPRLPLIVPLRDYAKAVSVESLFSEFLFRKHNIGVKSYRVFDELNRMGKFLLIFDGFDEMAARVDRQLMIDNFWQLASVVVPGSKAILTCRSEHFPSDGEGRDLLGAKFESSMVISHETPPQFEVLELLTLSDDKIRRLLEFRSDPATAALILKNDDLRELARRPIMSELILDALPEIREGRDLSLTRIYMYAVRRKMVRDIRDERTFTSLADKLYFLCELSWQMFASSRLSVNYKEFPDTILRCFGDRIGDRGDLDHWRYDMLGQTILIRDADGDYRPAHRSFLEFFAAYRAVAHLGIIHPDYLEMINVVSPMASERSTWTEFFLASHKGEVKIRGFERSDVDVLAKEIGAAVWTPAMLQMMLEMVDRTIDLPELVIELLRELSGIPSDNLLHLPDNLMRLVVTGNSSAFAGRDLDGVTLAGASLDLGSRDGLNLAGTSLRGASLARCDLENVNLRAADLSFADLSGVRYLPGEPFWSTMLMWPRPDRLVAVDRTGRPRFFEFDSHSAVHEIPIENPIPGMEIGDLHACNSSVAVFLGYWEGVEPERLVLSVRDLNDGSLRCQIGATSFVAYATTGDGAYVIIAQPEVVDGEPQQRTILDIFDSASGAKIFTHQLDPQSAVMDLHPYAEGPAFSVLTYGWKLEHWRVEQEELVLIATADLSSAASISNIGTDLDDPPVGEYRRGSLGHGHVLLHDNHDHERTLIDTAGSHRSVSMPPHTGTYSVSAGKIAVWLDGLSVQPAFGSDDFGSREIRTVPDTALVTAIALSPDGSRVVIASRDCQIRVFNLDGDLLGGILLTELYEGVQLEGATGVSDQMKDELLARGAKF